MRHAPHFASTLDESCRPFDALYRLGFGVTVNTDNRLMSSTTLTKELSLLCHTFGYDLGDLMNFQLNAAQAAFMSLEDKEVLLDRLVGAYDL